MTLDMPESQKILQPDEGTVALAEDDIDHDNSEECAILCESGARPGVYGLLVKCCAMSLFDSSVARFQETVLGGSISCLVALMVLDFGRVINLT